MSKFIKLSFLIVFIFLTIGCSSDDSSESNPINPPEWIIGTWQNDVESTFDNKYIFSVNNIIVESLDGTQVNYSEQIMSPDYDINEITNSNSEYAFKLSYPTSSTSLSDINFSFVFISNTQLIFSRSSSLDFYSSTYTKQ